MTGRASQAPPRARREFRRFLGIGLGGGRGKSTAVARLELGPGDRLGVAEAKLRHGHRGTGRDQSDGADVGSVFRDDVLIAYLDRWVDDATVVAIDAPLTMPPCVRCLLPCPGVDRCEVPVVVWMRDNAVELARARGRSDPAKPAATPYTQRAVEILLANVGLHPRETLGQGMGPLAARATHLRRALSPRLRMHENLIEVYPRATLIRRFGARDERRARRGEAERVWNARTRMLENLTDGIEFDYVWPELVVRSGRVFDAVVSAFTAYWWARDRWRGPADLVARANPRVVEHGTDAGDEDPGEDVLTTAVAALGDLWLEDGWIWAPP